MSATITVISFLFSSSGCRFWETCDFFVGVPNEEWLNALKPGFLNILDTIVIGWIITDNISEGLFVVFADIGIPC